MAIPDTGNPGSIYSQARELAKNGSPVTDKIDAAVDNYKTLQSTVKSLGAWLVANWKIALVGVLAVVIILKRL